MEAVLTRLGISPVQTRNSEILALCPGHKEITGKEDHNPSWWINSDTGAHICFSCGYRGGLWGLIAHVKGFKDANGLLDFADAKDWLYLSFDNLTFGSEEGKEEKPEEVFREVTKISEARLALFTDPPAHALKARGLTIEATQQYELLWDPSHSNWVTVIRDPYSNKLLGWQEKGFSRRYFNNYPQGVEKSKTLFGYAQYSGGRMIVVESPLDVVRLASVGVTGGVSTYGALISKEQISLIREADEIVFALDNDEAGIVASKKLLDLSFSLGFEAWFFNYSHTDMKDVGAMSRGEILAGLSSAKHVVNGNAVFS